MLQLKESELKKVLQDFHTLTRIRIVVFDTQMREVLSYPQDQGSFCSILRSNPRVNSRCMASDRAACRKCSQSAAAVTYECHVGLTESLVPIQDQLGIIGYLMFGQVLHSTQAPQRKAQLRSAYPEDRYPGIQAAIDAIPVKTPEEIAAAATLLQALTSYVYTNRFVLPKKNEFIRHLDQYIADHLTDSITVEALCREFHMSRTRFYEISMGYLGTGIAAYVRNCRIEQAKKLLTQTDLSITEIASATGFADYTHFSKVFRKSVGVCARTYRASRFLG